MTAKKAQIPPLVHAGSFTGMNAIPSGTIYGGQLVQGVGVGNLLGGDYPSTINREVPIVKPVSASDVASNGLTKLAGISTGSGAALTLSGTGILDVYKLIGVAFANAPIQDTYQQLQAGKPLAAPTNVTIYTYTNDTDVRRLAVITENDPCYLWLPYSGTALTGAHVGKHLTLSSGVDGAVDLCTDPAVQITVGKILGYRSDSSFSGVTVPGISAYVLTKLEFR